MDAGGEKFEYGDSDFEEGDEEVEFVESFMWIVHIFLVVYMSKNLMNGSVCIMPPPL